LLNSVDVPVQLITPIRGTFRGVRPPARRGGQHSSPELGIQRHKAPAPTAVRGRQSLRRPGIAAELHRADRIGWRHALQSEDPFSSRIKPAPIEGMKNAQPGMQRYANRSGCSGVRAFQIAPTFIRVQFTDGSLYRHDDSIPGRAALARHCGTLALS
jgi:hypothetical protein